MLIIYAGSEQGSRASHQSPAAAWSEGPDVSELTAREPEGAASCMSTSAHRRRVSLLMVEPHRHGSEELQGEFHVRMTRDAHGQLGIPGLQLMPRPRPSSTSRRIPTPKPNNG